MRSALFCLLVAALVAGCATRTTSTQTDTWSGGSTTPTTAQEGAAPPDHEETIHLAARGYKEIDFDMLANASLTYAFDATAPVRWDLHSHPGGARVATWANGTQERAEGTFVAPETDVYSLFFIGQAEAATLVVRMDGEFTIRS